MIKREVKAKPLCSSGFWFRAIMRVVEKYWEAESGSVCMICGGISHEQMNSCGNRASQYIICSWLHKLKEYCYNIANCIKKKKKICAHMIIKYANCGENHIANFS